MGEEENKIEAIRDEFPAVEKFVYLNTGSEGPLSKRANRAIIRETERQLMEGRSNMKIYEDEYRPMREDLRARFARLLGADPDEIAITHHTTEGMNISTWGLNWQPGDEIVTTMLEHEGGLLPVYTVARRYGLTLRVVDLGYGGDSVVKRITETLTSRTRLVVLSHVTFTTGAVLPIAEIVAAAHKVGARVAVDGAQSIGTIPVNVHQLGVDFYAATGQKWLCGPEGVGALYVRRDRLSELSPTFVGFSSKRDLEAQDFTGNFIPAVGAARFETSTIFWPSMFAMRENLRWFEEEVGFHWIFERIQNLTRACRVMLGELPGIKIDSPSEHAGLTSFHIDSLDIEPIVSALADKGVYIRWVSQPRLLRVSTSFFNNQEDLSRLKDGLVELLSPAT